MEQMDPMVAEAQHQHLVWEVVWLMRSWLEEMLCRGRQMTMAGDDNNLI